ncbi:MAG TPA: bifunctional demethylmenaquinone methyltransferase/2-methoxy-6-polyprenyl-1,4-benzoquinol methylase UbiE [Candidatus Dormibacteraeota bacterium]|nr:bifunctional demethylmenaquinone methyltransferase/2-methoxy-6-polyprenyl-1,4-benzoquinol methylase UbiE [Candidatus Dormibacteraeota bacterium]
MSSASGLPTVGSPEPEAVRDMFTGLAGRYDLLNSLLSQGQDRRWRRRAAQLTRAQAGDRVLDVCSGTGALAAVLSRRVGPGGEVIGVDLTDGMLKVARMRVPGVSFLVGDACHLPFPDQSFAAATMAFGLRNINDRPLALREMARVLRPGGRAVILEFSQVHPLLRPGYAWYSRVVIPPLARRVLGRDGAYRYLTDSIAAFAPPETVTQWMRQAGFRSVRHHRMTAGVVAIHVGRRPGPGLG